jgi:hypothetical protein
MFLLVDAHGRIQARFTAREPAVAALADLVARDPLAEGEAAVVELDEQGNLVGDAIVAAPARTSSSGSTTRSASAAGAHDG